MTCLQLSQSSGRWCALLGLFLLAIIVPARAQDGPSTASSDAAFEKYVDLDVLGAAWTEKNAGLLTDIALQLAEGERVLLRPHRGISSDQVFIAAVKVGAERKDKAALARLVKTLTALNKADLAAQAKLAEQFADKSRAVDPALTVSVEGTSYVVFLLMKDTIEAIKSVKVGQNKKGIEVIVKEIPKMTELSDPQRKALLKFAKEAETSMPKGDKAVDPFVESLNKLSEESRAARPGGGHRSGAHHPGGHHPGTRHPNRHNAPRSHQHHQAHWQRHFHHHHNRYHYYDPNFGAYYYYESSCSCYRIVEEGDE